MGLNLIDSFFQDRKVLFFQVGRTAGFGVFPVEVQAVEIIVVGGDLGEYFAQAFLNETHGAALVFFGKKQLLAAGNAHHRHGQVAIHDKLNQLIGNFSFNPIVDFGLFFQ